MTIEALYAEGRRNSLNLIRLLLAALVIVWHSYAVLGIPYPTFWAASLLGNMPVNGFFALSGFLIYRSWCRRPRVWDYLVARTLRIFPGFWVCLVVTAFVIAPVAVALRGGNAIVQLMAPESFSYVWKNLTLAMLQWRINGTPSDVPFTVSWDASLWTLAWEFLCYLFVLGLGVTGLLRYPWVTWALFGITSVLGVVTSVPGLEIEVLARVARFFGFFLAGVLVARYASRVRATWWIALLGMAVMVFGCWWEIGPAFQAPATALALVVLGGLFNPGWAELKHDLSYGVYIYGFPVQQLLVAAGISSLGLLEFSVVAAIATLPLAALSWFLVERPALGLRRALKPPIWLARFSIGQAKRPT